MDLEVSCLTEYVTVYVTCHALDGTRKKIVFYHYNTLRPTTDIGVPPITVLLKKRVFDENYFKSFACVLLSFGVLFTACYAHAN